VGRVLGALRRAFRIAPGAEISLEANPESASPDRLIGYRAAGVNRLSLGVQSFLDVELVRLGRLHSAEAARAAMRAARAAGFDNVSLDLMLWLPGQSMADWRASVEALVAIEPDHVSCYLLELYPGAPIRDSMARARWTLAPDDHAAAMYRWGVERLETAGYRQYEISNLAKPDRRCRHNLKYWSDGEWLGFGCGAHSTRAAARWRNLSDTSAYVDTIRAGRSPAVERRELAPDERIGEAAFTGLRLSAGLDLEAMRCRYGVDLEQRYGDQLRPFVDEGFLVREGARLRLSRDGMLISNEIMQVFV
jgi:oxygen-independent coproporphyrinogen-3 oxidase